MYDYTKETRFFSVHFTNHGYTRHADSLGNALQLGLDSGFEFSVWKNGTQYASYQTFGSFWILVNGGKDFSAGREFKNGMLDID